MLRRTLRDCEKGHKSEKTLQLLLVSACGEHIEIFAIAAFENLSLDVFVLSFCLHVRSATCVSNKSLAGYRHFCFLKVTQHTVS